MKIVYLVMSDCDVLWVCEEEKTAKEMVAVLRTAAEMLDNYTTDYWYKTADYIC